MRIPDMIFFFKTSIPISENLALVLTAHIPQPISTPTALGMMTFLVARMPPMGMPMPPCRSGMKARWWNTKGRDARFMISFQA